MYRYIILCLFLVSCGWCADAQITASLVLKSNPTPKLLEWMNDNSVINFIVTNPNPPNAGSPTPRGIIKTELKLADGTVIATTDLTKAPVYTLSTGTHIFYAKDVLPLEAMIFNATYKAMLDKTGELPEGTYQLSAQIVRPQTFEPWAQPQVKTFIIPVFQLPVLIKPYNGEVLKGEEAQTAIIFRWTPRLPQLQELPNYRIQVFEVLEHQQDVQALRANQPLLDITVKGVTQYIWRPMLSFIDDTVAKKFIWTIQTLDADNEPVKTRTGNGESRSEPFVFYIAQKNDKD